MIEFVDVTLRDGNQSVWGATVLTTAMMLAMAPVVDEVGFKAVDFTSGNHMAVDVRVHRENPWEKMRLVCRAMPNTRLSFGTSGKRFPGFGLVPDSIIELVVERVAAAGIRRVWITDASNDVDVICGTAQLAKKHGIEEVAASLVYTISPVHTDEYYAERARTIARCPDVDTVYLKDPTGLLLPERVRSLVPALVETINGLPLELHSHCTLALAPMCYVEAVQLGVTVLHTAVPPLANSTSLPSLRSVAKNLGCLGFGVHLDAARVDDYEAQLQRIAGKEGRGPGPQMEYDVSLLQHQVPGGMRTTLSRQLAEMKLEHRLGQVLEEIVRVRKELGYPIMVTPFSQFVGAQATANVVSGERYKLVSREILQYLAGWFGKPPGPLDQEVLDRAFSSPSAKAWLDKEPPQPSIKELREQMGLSPSVSDEEFLLRFGMPSQEVDRMLAAGPIKTAYW